MAEKWGAGSHRPELKSKKCKVCGKRIGMGYFVSLDKTYFHPKCFSTTDDHGATERQVRHVQVALSVLGFNMD
jgi:hypothetical protein